ncbi:DUF4177 domain-containing protein [Bacillus sp. S/N-304-OC-R1]|uniref:DUF4177 domain-containing protein n=1 Tax=Bacillus sp. S/N-304-OC-R1 TaxID=2758034 RepID=UPI001C8F16B0|nr:DUF4177 domain-containing protein [Bacillus sp. S/N-304-OC-R1]MBY0122140.1 DUF4177 domain-containing protein [Bacillus sp. S/N-304-OC-R1]
MKKWEYKVLAYNERGLYNNDEGLQNLLSNLGNEGWELVSSIPMVEGSGSDGDVSLDVPRIKFILKREK